jgi:hypothetical protein
MIYSTGSRRSRRAFGLTLLGAALVAAAAACTSTAATAAPAATETVAAASATPTPTPEPTPSASPTQEATPTAAPTPTPKATPKVTPLPSLAVGLCTGSQLKLTITAWYPDGGSGVYAHVTAKNKSSHSCNMRGSSEARIADGNGLIIGDAGASAAKVSSSDPVYPLAPGGEIYTIVQWFNWCKADPPQKVFVAMVQPFGLGYTIAAPLGNAPIPECWLAGQKTQVSSEAWLP